MSRQNKIAKVIAKRRAFHASQPKRLQAAWGPDSINTHSVFNQLIAANDLVAAKEFRDQCKQHGTDDPVWTLVLMQRDAA